MGSWPCLADGSELRWTLLSGWLARRTTPRASYYWLWIIHLAGLTRTRVAC